ncbi:VOC family protein [Microbulbifer sp. THAF38]|uniref:VOC family protein n=1 Tax=Microbulbifer sp. THAF38 TaxID=2587856 RepID=UPI001267E99E|nr:VOC family protein [Microbulbifer sp. THAF38]QFT55122.1 Glyoxalase-like domain protein [Microbulbifer sp. THAF38]
MAKFYKPNLQLIYVSDIQVSTGYYKQLFNLEPYFVSSRYVVFKVDGEADFAIWSGGEVPDKGSPRYTEIGINLKTDDEVEELYLQWMDSSFVNIHKELYTDVFGRTFLVKDPDGHIIRVSSAD